MDKNDTEALQGPITPQDVDAMLIALKASLGRLERRMEDNNPYLRGYQRGAIAAYRDVLRMLGQK